MQRVERRNRSKADSVVGSEKESGNMMVKFTVVNYNDPGLLCASLDPAVQLRRMYIPLMNYSQISMAALKILV